MANVIVISGAALIIALIIGLAVYFGYRYYEIDQQSKLLAAHWTQEYQGACVGSQAIKEAKCYAQALVGKVGFTQALKILRGDAEPSKSVSRYLMKKCRFACRNNPKPPPSS